MMKCFAALFAFGLAAVLEISDSNLPQDAPAGYDYYVVNFYDESPLSQTMVSVYDSAESFYQAQKTANQPDVLFSQVNIERFPHLSLGEDIQAPQQFVFTSSIHRYLPFSLATGESVQESAQRFANVLLDLTSSYLVELSCDQIQQVIEEDKPAFIFFGPRSKFDQMNYLHELCIYDRFSNPEQPILFYYNLDEKCREKRNLQEVSIVIYINHDSNPFVASGQDDLGINNLYHWIALSITQEQMIWSRRAALVLFGLKYNAIVGIDLDAYLTLVFKELSQLTRYNFDGLLPIVSEFNDPLLPTDLPQLSLLVGQATQYQSIWVYHGALEIAVEYDGAHEAAHILAWAQMQLIKLSLPEIQTLIEKGEDLWQFKAQKESELQQLSDYYDELVAEQGRKQMVLEGLQKELMDL